MDLSILVTGRNDEILQTLLRIIAKTPGWSAKAASSNDAAISFLKENFFNIVLLSSGISEADEAALRTFLSSELPEVIVIQHYGGGSGLLSNEITQALNKA